MKNKFTRILLVLILVLTVSVSAFACQDPDKGTEVDPLNEFTPISYEGTHVYTNQDSADYLVKGGVCEYNLVLPENPSTQLSLAKDEFVILFKHATGITLNVITDSSIEPVEGKYHTANRKYISFGDRTNLYKDVKDSFTYDKNALTVDGVRIVTVDKTVYLLGGSDYGVINAVYTFMTLHFNFEYYYRNCITIDKNVTDEKLKVFDVTDIPDIERRSPNVPWYSVTHDPLKTVDALTGLSAQDIKNRGYRARLTGSHGVDLQGVITDDKTNSTASGLIHNAMEYLPQNTDYSKYFYKEFIPDGKTWNVPFDTTGKTLLNSANSDNPKYTEDAVNSADWYSTGGYQICYNARGNAVSFDALAKRCAEVIEKSLYVFDRENYPLRNTITLTMEDVGSLCSCTACLETRNAEGFSPCGGVIRLLNAINVYVREWMAKEENEPYRRDNFKIVFFAYSSMAAAPALWSEAEQKYVPYNDSCYMDPGVGVYYADSVYFNYQTSMYDSINREGYENFEKWASLTDYIWFWSYGSYPSQACYFHDSYAFFNNDAYQYFATKNVQYIFNESQDGTGGNATQWQNLKSYYQSKLMWDSSLDMDQLIRNYFDAMYMDAADTMYAIWMQMRVHIVNVLNDNGLRLKGKSGDGAIVNKSFWQLPLLEGWVAMFDQAVADIEKYKTTNNNLYLIVKDRIDVEAVQTLYQILSLYGSSSGSGQLSNDQFLAYKQKLYNIVVNYPLLSYTGSSNSILTWVQQQ